MQNRSGPVVLFLWWSKKQPPLPDHFWISQKPALFSIFSYFDHEGARFRQRPLYLSTLIKRAKIVCAIPILMKQTLLTSFDFKSILPRFQLRLPLIVKTSKMECNKVIGIYSSSIFLYFWIGSSKTRNSEIISSSHWKYTHFNTRSNFLWLFVFKLSWVIIIRFRYLGSYVLTMRPGG